MTWRAAWVLASDQQSVALARTLVSRALAERGVSSTSPAIHDCLLVVSELVTNSVRADASVIELAVVGDGDFIVVEVCDDARGWPVQRTPAVAATTGRGLLLVGALSAEWGVDAVGPGKAVWARVFVPHDSAAADDEVSQP